MSSTTPNWLREYRNDKWPLEQVGLEARPSQQVGLNKTPIASLADLHGKNTGHHPVTDVQAIVSLDGNLSAHDNNNIRHLNTKQLSQKVNKGE